MAAAGGRFLRGGHGSAANLFVTGDKAQSVVVLAAGLLVILLASAKDVRVAAPSG